MEERDMVPVYPDWETVRLLGRGSFGSVYEIKRDVFGETERAACKVISVPQNESDVEELYSNGYDDASITEHFKNYLADIVREYKLMAEMKGHTNVVCCDDIRCVQKQEGIGWDILIKMELLTPLIRALKDDWSERRVIQLGKDIANALVLCRSRNIIHRDIKPQNIFVSQDGDFKLGDFGIAKTIEKTTGGTKIGTYNYMAPEVYNNQPYGHAADIYSLGLVLYWLLNERRMPFYPLPPAVPKASEMDKARLRRLRGDPLPAPAHGSAELKRIVLKACAFDPKERYLTAEALLNDLTALEGTGWQTASPAEDSDQTVRAENPELTERVENPDLTESAANRDWTDCPIIPDGDRSAEKPEPGRAGQVPPSKSGMRSRQTEKKKIGPILLGIVAALLILVVFLDKTHGTDKGTNGGTSTKSNTVISVGSDASAAAATLCATQGHTWSAWERVTEPGCTAAGEERRVCVNDPSHVETRELPALGHSWCTATCQAPKTCMVCGVREGTTTAHSWRAATCTSPKTCTVCGAIEGTKADHSWRAATCTSPKTCTVCGAKSGSALGHCWDGGTSSRPKSCERCGKTAPSKYDLKSIESSNPKYPNKITLPDKSSYLSEYETMYVKTSKGDSTYLYWDTIADSAHRRSHYLYEGDKVTVVARQKNFSCVIFKNDSGITISGWVPSKFLVN